MTLQYVPIIDLAPYFAGTPEGKLQVARAVDQACRDIGFLVITNHQIPTELIERVSRLTRQFFALPLAEKRKVDRPSPDMVRGYSAVAEESLSYSLEEAAPGDLKESFPSAPATCRTSPTTAAPPPAAFRTERLAQRHLGLRAGLSRVLRRHEHAGAVADAHLRPGAGPAGDLLRRQDRQAHQHVPQPQLPGPEGRGGAGADARRCPHRLRQPDHRQAGQRSRRPAGAQPPGRVGGRALRGGRLRREHRRPDDAVDQ